jgi:exonuclease SbcC
MAVLQGQVATKQQTLSEAEAAQSQLQDAEKQLAELQATLTGGQYELETAAQLKEIQAELAALGFDNAARTAAQQKVTELTHFGDERRQLEDASVRLPEEEERLQRDQARRERLLTQITQDQRQIDHLAAETEKLPEIMAEVTRLSHELDRLQREESMARSTVMGAEQKLNLVARQAKDRTQKEEKLTELRHLRGIYHELRTAFGKNGVQALLIEHTIPELEDEANNILSRMTDGRMNIQFLTQRETKTGQNLIETLDIRIADEIGTRSYELYSGGEAFRVNFAIRIALSKLLARRSGARLQTLVIDEGFGTQDAQGRERLVEAINKIQEEFEKIIVITHIDELKDAFPMRILIQKGPDGSRIITG